MNAEELAKALPFEAAGKLPFDANRAMLRHTLSAEVYQNGEARQEVIVMAAPAGGGGPAPEPAVQQKLEVVGIHVEPNALIECFGHLFRRKGDENVCTMFIDMGAGATHVVIAHGKNMVFAKHVPVGGDLMNRLVADALKVGVAQAKDMRIRASRQQAQAAQPAGGRRGHRCRSGHRIRWAGRTRRGRGRGGHRPGDGGQGRRSDGGGGGEPDRRTAVVRCGITRAFSPGAWSTGRYSSAARAAISPCARRSRSGWPCLRRWAIPWRACSRTCDGQQRGRAPAAAGLGDCRGFGDSAAHRRTWNARLSRPNKRGCHDTGQHFDELPPGGLRREAPGGPHGGGVHRAAAGGGRRDRRRVPCTRSGACAGVFQERDRVNAAYEDASKKIAEAQELEKQKERMIQKADTITALMERVRRSILLGELTRMRPQGVNFVSLELKSREIAPAVKPNPELDKARRAQDGAPPDTRPPALDVTLTLTGTAPTDADVAAVHDGPAEKPAAGGRGAALLRGIQKEQG